MNGKKLSEAKRRANDKYDREHMRRIVLKLHKTNDSDILAKLDSMENRTGYIRGLIRADIARGGK